MEEFNEADNCFNHGVWCMNNGRHKEAIDRIRKSLQIYQEHEHQEGITNCCEKLGECFFRLDMHLEAIANYKQCIGVCKKRGDKQLIARCHWRLATCFQKFVRYQEALDNYSKCLSCHQEIDDKELVAQCFIDRAKCFEQLGGSIESIINDYKESLSTVISHNLGKQLEGEARCGIGSMLLFMKRYQESKSYLEDALLLAKQVGNRTLECTCNANLSEVSRHLSQGLKAVEYAKIACAAIAETSNDVHEMYSDQIKQLVYSTMVRALICVHKYSEIYDYCMLNLECCKKIGNRAEESKALLHLSQFFLSSKKIDNAISYAEKCIEIAVDFNAKGLAYSTIGLAHLEKGKVEQGIKYFKNSLNIFIIAEDKGNMASNYEHLAYCYIKICNYCEALKCLDAGIKINIELGNEMKNASLYKNRGAIFQKVGNCQDAFKNYEQSLGLAEKKGDISLQGILYWHLSICYEMLQNQEKSQTCIQKAISLLKNSTNKLGEILNFQELGQSCYNNGNFNEAITNFHKGLHMAKEMHESHFIARSYENVAKCYKSLENLTGAMAYYKKALRTYVDSGDKGNGAMCLVNLGFIFSNLAERDNMNNNVVQCTENIQKFEKCLTDSLRIFEEMFDNLGKKYKYKISIVDFYVLFYKELALQLIEKGQPNKALVVCNRGRACSLGDTLVSRYGMEHQKVLIDNVMKEETLDENDLTGVLTDKSCMLFLAILRNSEYLWVMSRNKLLSSRRVVEQDQNIEEYINKLTDASFKLMDVQELSANDDLINTEHMNVIVPSTSEYILESTSIESAQQINTAEPLKELFKLIIAPIKEHLVEEEVVIVPEGPLNMVPFAALQDPDTGRYFCESKCVRYAPSITTLKILKQCPSNYHCTEGALVVGNPCVGKVMYRGEKTTISDLPGAEQEACVVSDLLNVTPLIGKSATKDAVLEKLKEGVAVIHIAAHGVDTTGEILFAPGNSAQSKETPEKADYMLTMREIQQVGIRAKLVVLSCCCTARGKIRAEGVIGIARAFLAAGARSVVASLWYADDTATVDFMSHFYVQLKLGKSVSVSLNEAQKKMIKSKRFCHPENWAPFIVIGDDVKIHFKDNRKNYFGIICIVVVSFIIMITAVMVKLLF